MDEKLETSATEDRRNFLRNCGRFAATVPPAMTILLSTSLSSEAIAASAGGGGGGGGGDGRGAPKDTGIKSGHEPLPKTGSLDTEIRRVETPRPTRGH